MPLLVLMVETGGTGRTMPLLVLMVETGGTGVTCTWEYVTAVIDAYVHKCRDSPF